MEERVKSVSWIYVNIGERERYHIVHSAGNTITVAFLHLSCVVREMARMKI